MAGDLDMGNLGLAFALRSFVSEVMDDYVVASLLFGQPYTVALYTSGAYAVVEKGTRVPGTHLDLINGPREDIIDDLRQKLEAIIKQEA
jgi:hypothetical protein